LTLLVGEIHGGELTGMKPYLLQTLKELALLGGIHNRIEISSQELADRLEASQQTASRYLLDLDTLQMITRELGIKKQLIQITEQGKNVLDEEFSQYKQIFDLSNKVVFKGKIVSGMGEGKYYTEQRGYVNQFQKKLGFIPYPGTLNVEIEFIERNKLRLLRQCGGIIIEGFTTKNRTFGSVYCLKAAINGVQSVIVLPKRSHYSNILEFISSEFLRDKLGVHDGDRVDVVIFLQECRESYEQ
jgi:riboflavin kinase